MHGGPVFKVPSGLTKYCIAQIRRRVLDLFMPAQAGIQMRRSAESKLGSGFRRKDGIRRGNCGGEY
jgi:hypothetical protein